MGLEEPAAGTFEAGLQDRVSGWGLVEAGSVDSGSVRTDTRPEQGYFPLDQGVLEGAAGVLHVVDGAGWN